MSGTGSLPDDPGDRLEELLAEHRDPPPPDEPDPFDPFAPAAPAGPGTAPEESEEEHEETLPDAPLFALLRSVEEEVGVDRIDRIWIFPPRRLQAGETAVVVVGAFPQPGPTAPDHADRRKVLAAHYTAHEDSDATRLALDEFGTAPTDRVGRLVEEVVERIKEGPADAPRSHHIDGRHERWHDVLHELAEAYLDQVQRDPRLRR